jgi:signal transduction histidine kinase
MIKNVSSYIALEEEIKSEFLSNISHELRTPISIIYGAIRNIDFDLKARNIVISEKSSEYLESIKKNVDRLLRLFDNLLEITNIRAGQAYFDFMVCNIVNVVEDISFSIAEYLRKHNISMIFDTEVEERYLKIDPNIIEKVMLNLISNAIKFSKDDTKIEIFIKVYEDEEKVYISIRDNGIGIEQEKLNRIFDIFSQANDYMTKSTEGSGVGLSLVKLLLDMLNADIKVHSELGKGSEIIIELPIDYHLDFDPYEEEIFEDFTVKKENLDKEFSDIDMEVK